MTTEMLASCRDLMQSCCLYQVIENISVVISDVGGIDIYILGDIKTHLYQYHYNFGSENG